MRRMARSFEERLRRTYNDEEGSCQGLEEAWVVWFEYKSMYNIRLEP